MNATSSTLKYGINFELLEILVGILMVGNCIRLPVNLTIALSTDPKCLLIVSPLCWKCHCRSLLLAFFDIAYMKIATCSSTATPLVSCRRFLSRSKSTNLQKIAFSILNSRLQPNSWPFKTSDTYSSLRQICTSLSATSLPDLWEPVVMYLHCQLWAWK